LKNVFAATLMLVLSTSLLLIGGTLGLNYCAKNGTTGQIGPSTGPTSLGQQAPIVSPKTLSNDTDSTVNNANGTSSQDQSVAPAQSEPVPVFTNVSIMPNNVVVVVGQTFSVDVWINNVTDMAGWDIDLLWNSSVLTCIQAQVNTPPEWGGTAFDWFNKTAADVDANAVYTAWQFGPGIINNYNALYGELCDDYNITCGLYEKGECWGPRGSPYENTFSGSLVIVTLTFQALQAGSTSLGLSLVKIANGQAGPIAHIVYSSLVEVQDWVSFEAARLGTVRALRMVSGENP
jgi:hypothetical protein